MTETLVTVSEPVEGVRVLAFNRPTKRNALSQDLIDKFLEHLGSASSDQAVKAIVVTGSSTFFCGELRSLSGHLGNASRCCSTFMARDH